MDFRIPGAGPTITITTNMTTATTTALITSMTTITTTITTMTTSPSRTGRRRRGLTSRHRSRRVATGGQAQQLGGSLWLPQ